MPFEVLYGFGVVVSEQKFIEVFNIYPGEIYGPGGIEGKDLEVYPDYDFGKFFVGEVLHMVADGDYETAIGNTGDIVKKMIDISEKDVFKFLKEKFGAPKWRMFNVYDA